jgi:hypothetical protein
MNFRAIKTAGKIDINWELINLYIARWKDGTMFDVEVVRRQKRKSDPMRKYYWGAVLQTYMKELGYERDEDELFHKQLKIVYFRIKPDNKGIYRDKDIPSVFSNDSELTVSIKKEFMDWVIRKAAQDGVYIPDPNGGLNE